MKNHFLDEKKKHVKIYDNTKNTKIITTLSSRAFEPKEQTAEQYCGKVPKDNMWTLRAEIDDQMWFDRLDRQLFYWNNREAERSMYPSEWYIPTQPGQ